MAVLRLLLLVALIGTLMAMAESKSAGKKAQDLKALAEMIKAGLETQGSEKKASKMESLLQVLKSIGTGSMKEAGGEYTAEEVCAEVLDHVGTRGVKENAPSCTALEVQYGGRIHELIMEVAIEAYFYGMACATDDDCVY